MHQQEFNPIRELLRGQKPDLSSRLPATKAKQGEKVLQASIRTYYSPGRRHPSSKLVTLARQLPCIGEYYGFQSIASRHNMDVYNNIPIQSHTNPIIIKQLKRKQLSTHKKPSIPRQDSLRQIVRTTREYQGEYGPGRGSTLASYHGKNLLTSRTAKVDYELKTPEGTDSIKIQPNKILFLCINCFEYFLIPERATHSLTCTFQCNQHEVDLKITKVIGILEVVSTNRSNRFIRAVHTKLSGGKHKKPNCIDLDALEVLVLKGPPHLDLDWKELFWVAKQLTNMKERLQAVNQTPSRWMFCR